MPTQARLKELLRYDPATGLFTWCISPCPRVQAGSTAGSINKDGYYEIRIDYKLRLLHRLAFTYMTGEPPKHHVDHVNGIRADNRWVNLRDVSQRTNTENRRQAHKGSTSGLLGVSWHKGANKWVAEITAQGKRAHLGYFTCPQEAHQAYLTAKRALHAGCTI